MRALPLCLLALLLAGCSATHRTQPIFNEHPTYEPSQPAKPKPVTTRPAAIKLYKDPGALVGTPFRDLGEVSGESCQVNAHDAQPSISNARRRMLNHAATMKANAVLLHQCQIVSDVAGCHQQAVCQGSALNVSFK
ncbi:Rcs stress response system protein RcsF [Serratia sp. M24T3]|uniref:Rcs stress response system protein RcsF n=1 Tax=Serratia sp. M24T3 TaxID=932213 RepID=UPI00025BC393|nr:Rcs stress response system protein RcsF [Serratia sp. M24T3]EIC83085.1 outer membrane lipoprotein [Serratia sp. M24T3]